MAPWVLVALRPLFHYDRWREAWTLRLVGHKYGPVLKGAGSKNEPQATGERQPSRLQRVRGHSQVEIPQRASRALPARGSTAVVIVAGVVLIAAGALGFILAHNGSRNHGTAALSGRASAGVLRLSFPSGWQQEAPTAAQALGLSDGIALARAAARDQTLVVGRTATPNPELLPPRVLAALPSVPTPQTIHLGSAEFYRYLNLSPRGQHRSMSIYAMSTTIGTVLGVCSAPDFSSSLISTCEQSLGTLTLTSGKVLPPGPIPAYASALSRAIKKLNRVRTAVGVQLRKATTARTRATAAYALGIAHTRATATLSHVNPGPASAANSALIAALNLNAAAYRELGRAASLDSVARYKQARALLTRAAGALTAACSRVRTFGYSISC